MKKELKTKHTKEKILKAALNEFGEKGYANASLNTICESGISKGLIYHNFKNKDELYLVCLKSCFERFMTYLNEANFHYDIEQYMSLRYDYFQKNPLDARLIFESLFQPPTHLISEIKNFHTQYDEFTQKIYVSLIKNLKLRKDVDEKEAMKYFSLMQTMYNAYFFSFSYNQSSFAQIIEEHERGIQKILDFMLYGIAQK